MAFKLCCSVGVILFFNAEAIVEPRHYHLIELITSQHPFTSQLAIGPAFDVAYEFIQETYPALNRVLSRTRIHRPDIKECVDGEAEAVLPDLLPMLDNNTGMPVIVTAGNREN